MDSLEKDEVPMLSATYLHTDAQADPQFRRFQYRTRSASISSIPTNSIEFNENESSFVGHTGPLRSDKKTPFIQMSGPLYVNRKHDNLFRPAQTAIGRKATESTVEKYPSFNGMDQNDWPNNNYMGKNEHLLKSGQLGMCNDPYCLTCPTYYNFKGQQKNSKSSVMFDQKVPFFSCFIPSMSSRSYFIAVFPRFIFSILLYLLL